MTPELCALHDRIMYMWTEEGLSEGIDFGRWSYYMELSPTIDPICRRIITKRKDIHKSRLNLSFAKHLWMAVNDREKFFYDPRTLSDPDKIMLPSGRQVVLPPALKSQMVPSWPSGQIKNLPGLTRWYSVALDGWEKKFSVSLLVNCNYNQFRLRANALSVIVADLNWDLDIFEGVGGNFKLSYRYSI